MQEQQNNLSFHKDKIQKQFKTQNYDSFRNKQSQLLKNSKQILNFKNTENQESIQKQWQFQQNYCQFFVSQYLINKLKSLFSNELAQEESQEIANFKDNLLPKSILQKIKNKLQQKLTANGFLINQPKYPFIRQNAQIRIKLINQTEDYKITEFYCQLGKYSKTYTILNNFQQSSSHSLSMLGSGGMGEVFKNNNYQDGSFCAIKCMKFNNDIQNNMKLGFKEFFINDLLSSLCIAPKILRQSGFDFVIFRNCMEFEMQRCKMLQTNKIFQQDLKWNLFQMHLLKIVHNDIKLTNIMYSSSFQRNVFIDFGISQYINQIYGEKTLTKFKGTYQYCSQEMKQLIKSKNLENVDLYKNDIYMMKKALISISSNKNPTRNEKIQQDENLIQQWQQQKQFQTNKNIQYLEELTKYLLYKSTSKIKLSSQLKYTLERICKLQESSQSQQSSFQRIKHCKTQIFQFVFKFKRQLLHLLLEYKLFSNFNHIFDISSQLSYQINFQHFNTNIQSDNNNYLSKCINERKILFQNLSVQQQYEINSEIDLNFQMESIFLQKDQNITEQNIQFILFNRIQGQKLKREEYFSLFISYVSIWHQNYKHKSMLKRIRAAQVFKQIVSEDQKEFTLQYLNEVYSPDVQFIKSQYNSLLYAYGYLLSYCFSSPTNQFKAKYILTIIKQMILLNFKYFFFLNKAFAIYIKFLINNKNKINNIFSLILINKCEISWLTRNHYTMYGLNQEQYEDVNDEDDLEQDSSLDESCNCRMIFKFSQAFIGTMMNIYFEQTNKANKLTDYQKQEIFVSIGYQQQQQQNYYKSLINYERIINLLDNQINKSKYNWTIKSKRYYKYVLNVLNQCYKSILKGFNKQQILTKIKLKSHLIKIFNPLHQEQYKFDKKLFQAFTSSDTMSNPININMFLSQIDSKIQSQQISKYLFLDLRFILSNNLKQI